MTTLRLGARGAEVGKLQSLLNTKVFPSPKLFPDNSFGSNTEQAVIRFQRSTGLTADGVVGSKTWDALEQNEPSIPKPAKSHVQGDAGWMAYAEAELGVSEDSKPGNHDKRIIEYHSTTKLKATSDETPWCSSFVNWVMTQAGYKGTDNALAKSWLNWGTGTEYPKKGAITVIKKKSKGQDQATGSSTGYHVGFFVTVDDKGIKLLGGNQGDRVKYSTFALQSYNVEGYRVP